MPDVLMVVPTRGDRPEYLADCLASVAEQDVRPHVRIVTQRHAQDAVEKAAGACDVEVLDDPGRGLSAAVNAGWCDLDRWKYVTWIGDDDLLQPGSLAATTSALEQATDAPFVYGGLRWIGPDGTEFRRTVPIGIEAGWLMRHGLNLVWQPGSLYRSAAVAAAGPLREDLPYAMDFDLLLRMTRLGRPKVVRRLLASYRVHPDAISSHHVTAQADEALCLQRAFVGGRSFGVLRPGAVLASRVLFRATSRKSASGWSFPGRSAR